MINIEKGFTNCRNCKLAEQLVSYAVIVKALGDGTIEVDRIPVEPIGQVRNCYPWLEILLKRPERFIYPKADDTCVNPGKFKQK